MKAEKVGGQRHGAVGKAHATKPDDRMLIPGTHVVEEHQSLLGPESSFLATRKGRR